MDSPGIDPFGLKGRKGRITHTSDCTIPFAQTSAEGPRRYVEALLGKRRTGGKRLEYIFSASALLVLELRDDGIHRKSLANELTER